VQSKFENEACATLLMNEGATMTNELLPAELSEFQLASMDYLETAQKCADEDLNFELGNKYLGHAQALFCIALRKSKSSFNIFTGRLPELFLKFIKDDLKAALNRKVKISIVFADASVEANNEILALKKECPESLRVFRFKKDFPQLTSHFFVADGKMYRIEEPHKPLTEEECHLGTQVPAIANFHDPSHAETLENIYKTICSEHVSMAV